MEWVEPLIIFSCLFGGGGLLGVGFFYQIGRYCSPKKWEEIERNMANDV